MATRSTCTFGKEERLCSKRLMQALFERGKSRSMVANDIRVVYKEVERTEGMAAVQMLVSVSKRHFKRAVKRNRIKRQVREAYRLCKAQLIAKMQNTPSKAMLMAFIWQSDELAEYKAVEKAVSGLVERVTAKL